MSREWIKGPLPLLIVLPVLSALMYATTDMPFFIYLASITGVNVILAVSLNIVNGITGQFSIGHAGFMAVGAYAAGYFSRALGDVQLVFLPEAVSDQLIFFVAVVFGGVLAALFGFLVGLPSLRLRGDYLAIVTLGFGEIIRVFLQNTEALGRALGLRGIPQRSSLLAVWVAAFLTILTAKRIVGSSHGRSLLAIREDEVAAEAMGVDTTGYKVRAFVVSSFFAGVAGALFAHFVPIINPSSFTFVKSIEIVVMVVAGGLGSTTGAVLTAVVLTLLPEQLRTVLTSGAEGTDLAQKVDQLRMPIYGMTLVALMLLRPQGLFGTREIWDLWPRSQPKASER
ncbi:MAG: branched-chain amino acid ABC transporter permease [Deltaproteobacteria bacterium]|nr:branched-chain amino acid ABC transporter permease [Deltaproteobacteria bacterium]